MVGVQTHAVDAAAAPEIVNIDHLEMPRRMTLAEHHASVKSERPGLGEVVHYTRTSYRIGPRGQYLRIPDDERNYLLKLTAALGITPALTEY